jgi:hypothetical protein
MNCVRCGLDAGYNRVVVDLLSGVELGGFCVDCEHEEFGRSLERGFWTGDDCALCDRDGHFALATWEPEATEREGDLHCSVDYDVTPDTVLACDEHLHAITDGRVGRDGRPVVKHAERTDRHRRQ